MSHELHLDFETRSEADLKKVGAYAYFEHPSTQILCMGYAFQNEEPELWLPDDIFIPDRILAHIAAGGVITAWNAAFERLAWRHIMTPRHNAPPVADHQWQCTMTEALSMNLPGALKDAAPVVGLDITKDDEGHRLMMKMCKPRKVRAKEDINGVYWWEGPDLSLRLGQYCLQDVRVEAEISRRLLRLRPSEKRLSLLDMKINDRGVYVDTKLCQAAQRIVETATDRLDDEMRRVTAGQVTACSNAPQLTKWLNLQGIKTDSVDREHIEDLLILDLPDNCRRALELRQEGSKTSTAKIGAMLARQQQDKRMRGNLQFYGASATGRWAARGAQLQNLTRPKILGSKAMEPAPLEQQIQSAIECIEGGSSMVIELIYGQPLTLVADTVRSMICAAPGNILRSSDFANIEGRGVAWLAGQEDILDAFRAYDAGTGPDLYLVTAAAIFNVDIKKAKEFRQIGKVASLALGYQGGPRAFAKMAKASGLRIAEHYDGIWQMAAQNFKDEALKVWEERGRKTGMSREGWLASEVIKLAWRTKHGKIVECWKNIEQAAINAVQTGEVVSVSKAKYRKAGSFLFCLLPSGRALCYPYPRIQWENDRPKLVYKAIDQFTKKWEDQSFYGGLGTNNIVQGIARDIMAEAMERVEKVGYNIVLTIHDEILAETPKAFGSLNEFNKLMMTVPVWAEGFPLAVGGWEGHRYRKG